MSDGQAKRDEALAAGLRDNPAFLAERPELYRVLVPPRRVHGERLADHMAAMILASRGAARAAEARAEAILVAGRAAAGMAERVQGAVLALIGAADPLDCIATELPARLGVDAVSLCLESGAVGPFAALRHRADVRMLPPGAIAALLGGRDVLLRDQPADAGLLHAEAAMLATRDALIRVPMADGGGGGGGGMLALVSRDGQALQPGQGAGSLAFLGRALALLLARPAESGRR